MKAKGARLIAIADRLDELWAIEHAATKERDVLRREKSAILVGMTWAERQAYDRALMDRAAKPLDAISAVRAK